MRNEFPFLFTHFDRIEELRNHTDPVRITHVDDCICNFLRMQVEMIDTAV